MIDIFDLNYDLSSENIGQLNKIDKFKGKNILYGLTRFVVGFFVSFLRLRFNIFFLKKNDINFLISSDNQFNALVDVFDEVGGRMSSISVGYNKLSYRSPDFFYYLFSLPFIFFFIFEYFKCNSDYKRKSMRICFDRYLLTYGIYIVTYICYLINRPSLVFLSNDHCVWHRIALRIAIKLGIKTAYIQHAMVSQYFPRLEFDYAFLDGYESRCKYKIAPNCNVYLIGALRYSNFRKEKFDFSRMTIGVGFNSLDSIEYITCFIKKLISITNGDYNIIIRLHPKDKRMNKIQHLKSDKVKFSDSKIEASKDFAMNIDMLIAGTTGLHLDIALYGGISFMIKGWGEDYYGFIDKGIVTLLDDISLIKNITQFEFHSLINKTKESLYLYDESLLFNNNESSLSLISNVIFESGSKFNYDKKSNTYRYVD
ncbi:hypothetical protein AYI74_06070 [Shewanella algae]|uniref:hypothetical protein n=1 Tax=Shewanella algae TaxID=38313 RepID=UPI0011B5FF90|nr:hypothetical protein [Shewanella algae]TWU69333.1 hypothetical protein AYI74_06070 [Shewanella algae]